MVQPSEKKINIWLPLLFAITLVVGILLGVRLQNMTSPQIVKADTESPMIARTGEIGRIEELIRYIEARYVDEVDREEMVEKAINKLLEQLDPHSNYIASDRLQEVTEQLQGNFEGVGIEFILLEDTVTVVSPISGGPSEQVGIMAGDKIVEIEDSIVAGVDITIKDIIAKLRGEKGSEVRVGIKRGGQAELMDFTITRDEIPLESVEVAYMLDETTGLIKINRFSATTHKEFMEELGRLVKDEGMKDLVIDLRQNPGGYLGEATSILNQLFSEKDKLLVYTEGRAVRRNDYETTGRPFFEVEDIAVLVDEGSASASEILAGAIQDHDRGVIIGRRSFGKGLVQEQYDLKDGSALRLTVARYYTPSGRSIQKPYDDRGEYDEDVYNRFKNGELMSADSITASKDTNQYNTSSGRPVFGGGGIMPDIFIPIDTILLNENYLKMRQHLPQFVYRLIEKEPIGQEMTINKFNKEYYVSDNTIEDLAKFAGDKGEKIQFPLDKSVKSEIRRLIKARVARHYFKEEGFFSVWNEDDEMIKAARKQLKQEQPIVAEKGIGN